MHTHIASTLCHSSLHYAHIIPHPHRITLQTHIAHNIQATIFFLPFLQELDINKDGKVTPREFREKMEQQKNYTMWVVCAEAGVELCGRWCGELCGYYVGACVVAGVETA